MDVTSHRFAEKVRKAIADPQIQRALETAGPRFDLARRAAFSSFPEGEALRDLGRDIKARTLAELDQQLARLANSVERVGGEVHWASDAAEARRIVVDLAEGYGAKRVVKSKSMTTEEIGLNQALEGAGIETIETDLGEYIIQLAGEAPFHIIAPALHKSREEVTELFIEKLGSRRLESREELTQEARKILRDAFRGADLGITGVNFAVADTGTIAVVENEGNARLSTSLPKVHIAVMGMEKVIPDMSSLSVFLKILARSATGQKMSSYVSCITGPRRQDEEDGPEAFHLVILDNGRSRLLADPELREALRCIRCGACLNICPVYRHAGGHSYGWVYSGPIGAVITPSFVGREQASALPFASSLCGACRDVCPVRIDLPRMLLAQRRKIIADSDPACKEESSRMSSAQAAPAPSSRRAERLAMKLFTATMASPRRYRWAGAMLQLASRFFRRRGGWWRPPLITGWTQLRDVPEPARQSFRQRWASRAR